MQVTAMVIKDAVSLQSNDLAPSHVSLFEVALSSAKWENLAGCATEGDPPLVEDMVPWE